MKKMKKILLIFVMFLIVFSSSAKKERLIEIGFTICTVSPEGEVLIYNTLYLGDAQDIFNTIYKNIYVELFTQLENSNYFRLKSENSIFSVERKKLITKKNCYKKFKRIKEKEKEQYYNLF